jgi:hypothetical protein
VSKPFAVGDRVTWMHCTSNGRRMSFKTWEGKVTSIHPHAIFVNRRGTSYNLRPEDLRHSGETSELTEMVNQMGTEQKAAQ